MTFRDYGNRNGAQDAAGRPGQWFNTCIKRTEAFIRPALEAYIKEKAGAAVYNAAPKVKPVCVTLDGQCIHIPATDAGIDTADATELGEDVARAVGIRLLAGQLQTEFMNVPNCVQKSFFRILFADDEARFDELCREAIG